MAHQGGGGLGGSFDFGQIAGARAGRDELVGEDVGVGGDDAEKIVQGVGDDLILGGREHGEIGNAERGKHLRSLSKMRLGLVFHQARGRGGVKRVRGRTIEGEAARGAAGESFRVEFREDGRIEGEDGESGVLGANFFDVVKALEIPGVDIESDGVPTFSGESLEKIGERIDAMDCQGVAGRFLEDFGKS